MKCLICP